MKALTEMAAYRADVERAAAEPLPWDRLAGKSIVITGGTGLIGSFVVDVLLKAAPAARITLLGRNAARAEERFGKRVDFLCWDAFSGAAPALEGPADFVLHLASNTHPRAYATSPIGTIAANVIATNSLLALAADKRATRFLFASSNEIYGENRGDAELFDESYCGYIDCNTLRAGYPESKRCGEALCQAYIAERGLDCVVARLTRTFGPTVLKTDSKASSQFFANALRGEDIVLKSEGRQFYSFLHVADSATGLLYTLLKGERGQAYNIADASCDTTLRELAAMIAQCAGRSVVFDPPDKVELAGFSKATKARLDGSRLRALGWKAHYSIREAVQATYALLKEAEM